MAALHCIYVELNVGIIKSTVLHFVIVRQHCGIIKKKTPPTTLVIWVDK